MNKQVSKLCEIAKKKDRLIIGLMSGTSLDGVDVGLCKISGNGLAVKVDLLAFESFPYSVAFKHKLKEICFLKETDLELISLLNIEIAQHFSNSVNQFLIQQNLKSEAIDLIASHGQTIYHSPARLRNDANPLNATLQIGDGDYIAVQTGIITISDFRQKNIAEGKEGAPLALYGDYLLFRNNAENRILLNIGGIANFTILKKDAVFANAISTDVGPGNTLMDQFILKVTGNKYYDLNASMALEGVVDTELLNELLNHPFFNQQLPKTTGPELFNLKYLENAIEKSNKNNLKAEDIMATLNRFTAEGISVAINQIFDHTTHPVVYTSGGGFQNPLLMKNLEGLVPFAIFKSTSDLMIHPDAKETVLFAILANETVAGDYEAFGDQTKSMGKISFPN
ncbi:MAG: anhydro-N-acetylmuramic acid kinase [Bacteroidetes bacterium]|nr:anhydro-N-acetylmuramic acid kinase [Bacteroidota bacterium]MBU1484323.1 anhydro-N-acetylmuramic acid kinase [Bacteroidota bacterium]MBU2045760.1 anhydro-N-acetylmuramic acid kinase [Bacteroidota bacterium]MBU2266810.1 anhydro-N-acetylmuramic acid kinase [Bacteroidota bacterium]MBU2377013.1 anhydro-N-acetylmuramic acid kinase [Bacteroidota bacterium]